MEWNRAVGLRRRRGTRRERREGRPDVLFHLRSVDVADGDDRHVVRPVPRVVEGAKALRRRVADDVGLADRQPLRVLRPIKEDRELLVADARARAEAEPPLLDDDRPLLVDLFLAERQPAGIVGERREPLCDHFGVVRGQIEHVHGFVEARVGVDVRSESRADALEVREHLARLEVRAAVERHVLDQMGETLLIVGLVQRAGFHREAKRHALGRTAVLADEVLEPVGQRRGSHGLVERDFVLRVECRRRRLGLRVNRDGCRKSDDGKTKSHDY